MSSLLIRCQANTYKGYQEIVLQENVPSFIELAIKEVNQLSFIQKRKLQHLLTLSLLLIPSQVSAQEDIKFPLLKKAYGLDILPDDIVTILIELIIGCGIIGVALSILCLMIAGGYRMLGQTDKARTWSVDIIKGLGQILLAPVIILILVTVTGLVFHNIPGLELFF